MNYNSWIIGQENHGRFSKEFYESIFSLGNGYMGIRGFNEEDEGAKYEICTYIAGIFDYFKYPITDMVNTPNFFKTQIYVNGNKLTLSKGKLIKNYKALNMKEGTLTRCITWEDNEGHLTKIQTIKFLSLKSVHNAVLRLKITPLNYSGEIQIETGIDTDVRNAVINDDQMQDDLGLFDFLLEEEKNTTEDGITFVKLQTHKSQYKICEAFATNLSCDKQSVLHDNETIYKNRYAAQKIKFYAKRNNEYTLDKFITVWTSRDIKSESLKKQVIKSTREVFNKGFCTMLNQQRSAWEEKWKLCDIVISGDDICQKAIRFNIFQLIQINSEDDPRVSIGARGILHGRYKGCYFWDTEIFMFPFYLYTNPKAAKNLLLYRYYTLQGARKNAKMQNLDGARYAWMCSIDGTEQCETWDIGFCEVHITADVAYAINHYYKATEDIEFIKNYGLEILIETARYWRSRFSYQEDEDKYNMLFVKGPNEYGGATINNTYTTVMAIYNMKTAITFIQSLKSKYPHEWQIIKSKINYDDTETNKWKDIIEKAVINYDSKKNLYIEDDNFFKLESLDLHKVKKEDNPLYRTICFDRLQRYRVLKQADVLLLMFLLPDKFSEKEKLVAWNFYEPITTHDSSLSFGTHAGVAARLGLIDKAYNYFVKSVTLDLNNIMDNTGLEGIHAASLGASWQAIINGFAGVQFNNNVLSINPHLPKEWDSLKFRLCYKDCIINFNIMHDKFFITFESETCNELVIKVKETIVKLQKGKRRTIDVE